MRLSSRAAVTTLAAAALAAGMAPAAGAASSNDDHRDGRGNLRVCVDDLRGRDAEINVRGRSNRDAETHGGCTVFTRLRTGLYEVELEAPRRCHDDSTHAVVRRNRTTTVFLDADCPRWRHWDGDHWDGGDDWWDGVGRDRGHGGDSRG